MAVKVKDSIEQKLEELGFEIGCYCNRIDSLITTKKLLNKVLDNLDQEHTDVFITVRGNLYVIEISTVDNEKDINLYTGVAYFSKYGNLEDALDNEDITKYQYEEIKCTLS